MAQYDLKSLAFPKLDLTQLANLGDCPKTLLKHFKAGQKLFEAGDRDAKFYVVKSGEVEIADESGDAPKTVAVHGRSEFIGDANQLTGGPALVTVVARTDCEVFEISDAALREILNKYPELGDVILQAFIARRQLLTASREASPDCA